MKKYLLLFVGSLAMCMQSFAQSPKSDKISVAVFPFIYTGSYKEVALARLVEEMVKSEFVEKNRFQVMDRSRFGNVLEELKVQGSEVFIDSKVVKKGKQLGAEYLVTGFISEFQKNEIKKSDNVNVVTSKFYVNVGYKYKYQLKMSFQIIKLETGQSLASFLINKEVNGDEDGAIVCEARKQIRQEIRKLFPAELRIVDIDKLDDKGLPKNILITGGEEIFGDNSVDDNLCPGSKVTKSVVPKSVSTLFAKKTLLKAYYEEMVGTFKRQKDIGVLKLEKSQGQELALCSVKSGAAEIQQALKDGKKILLIIIQN